MAFAGPVDSAASDAMQEHLTATLREALSNVAKHAHATNVSIDVTIQGTDLVLLVVDDGVGIGEVAGSGNGLANMRDRAEALAAGAKCARPARAARHWNGGCRSTASARRWFTPRRAFRGDVSRRRLTLVCHLGGLGYRFLVDRADGTLTGRLHPGQHRRARRPHDDELVGDRAGVLDMERHLSRLDQPGMHADRELLQGDRRRVVDRPGRGEFGDSGIGSSLRDSDWRYHERRERQDHRNEGEGDPGRCLQRLCQNG